MTGPPPPVNDIQSMMASINIGEDEYQLVDIRSTGDILLEVTFKNGSDITKSIPKDALRNLRARGLPIPSPTIFYRARLDTLTKNSEYFRLLVKPQFAEGLSVAEAFASLAASGQDPTKIEANRLPRVKIVDEDIATKTFGREIIFADLLRILHGSPPLTTHFTTHSLTVLVLMADRYGATSFTTKHMQKTLLNHKFPITVDKNGEESLRQKIIIRYHTDPGLRFALATKELILRGSQRWSGFEDFTNEYQTAWWDLPYGLEAELAYRRSCVLRTIASIQAQFIEIYTGRERQCKLGYDSSSSCDSFQLGEMVKFLARKSLLFLIPFQAVNSDDPDYVWPEAYSGDIEYLVGLLRQCPAYQIDANHGHCGLRTKILPALDFIKSSIDIGLGVKLTRTKNGPVYESWMPTDDELSKQSSSRKSFWVGGSDGEDVDVAGEKPRHFDFASARPKAGLSRDDTSVERSPRGLFTAEKWNWLVEPNGIDVRFGVFKNIARV